MATVIAFANHKGGCTKTTSASNLGAALAMAPLNRRVLLIDADPQANLSEVFGCDDPRTGGMRLEDALNHNTLDVAPAAWRTREDLETREPIPLAGGIHLLPCTGDLAEVVFSRMQEPDFPHRLAALCALYDDAYDFILIDTPPGLQPLSTMAMLAASWVIVPFRPSDTEVGGAIKIARFIENDMAALNPNLRLLGALMNATDKRWLMDRDARQALKDQGVKLLDQSIPNTVRAGEAPRYMAPMVVTEPDSRVGAAYRELATSLTADLESRTLKAVGT